ncbi:Zn-ribbon domain-containing OB-fold protein [Celeribacter sp. ULVN23_4]
MMEYAELPPHARSLAARSLIPVAKACAFDLPRCADCGRFSWPVHELCPYCLGDLDLAEAPRAGRLLAKTAVMAPVAPYFRQSGIEWHVGLIAMAAGPSALAFTHPKAGIGQPVDLSLRLDRAGQAVLYAAPKDHAPTDDPQWQEMNMPSEASG